MKNKSDDDFKARGALAERVAKLEDEKIVVNERVSSLEALIEGLRKELQHGLANIPEP